MTFGFRFRVDEVFVSKESRPLRGGSAAPPPAGGGSALCGYRVPAPIWGAGHAPPRRGGQRWQESREAVVGFGFFLVKP